MIDSLGIIGAGHLATFFCEGLRASGWIGDLVVSSHNREKAEAFRQRFDASKADCHQEVIDRTKAVLVAVRPAQIQRALSGLIWPGGQKIISAAAGVKISQLAEIASDTLIVRVMPISAAAYLASPTIVFPEDQEVSELLSHIGSAIPMADETEFDVASANAATYGWYFALIEEIFQANIRAGLSPASAKLISVGTLAAATKVSLASTKDNESILETLATPGGITAHGLKILKDRRALEPWSEAFDAIVDRLTRDETHQD